MHTISDFIPVRQCEGHPLIAKETQGSNNQDNLYVNAYSFHLYYILNFWSSFSYWMRELISKTIRLRNQNFSSRSPNKC